MGAHGPPNSSKGTSPRGLKKDSRERQDGTRGVQKRPGRAKMRKTKTFKTRCFFLLFSSLARQDDPKRGHMEPLGWLLGDLGVTWGSLVESQVVAKRCKWQRWHPKGSKRFQRWSRTTSHRQQLNGTRGSFLSNCPEIRSHLSLSLSPSLYSYTHM